MSTNVEKVKARLSILDVVSSYVKLTKAGANYKARCPFHTEKTPSFVVSPSRDSYHCFGCGKGGDIFSFVQDIEGVPFIEALTLLGERAGVDIVKENPEARNEKEIAREVLRHAAHFYRAILSERSDVEDYLKGRGLSEETIKEFVIGYAPHEWSSLRDYLVSRKFSDDAIEKAGLALKGNKKDLYYDRFRGRIMFPITDHSGRIVGFTGRIFEEEEGKDMGKYVNTPQTALYDKSRVLYPLHKAKDAIRKEDAAIFVEGQMDVLLAHQVGVKNTVAVSGTALTQDQVLFVKRFTDNVIFALDADDAGIKALERGSVVALSLGCNVEVVTLPLGKDPADVIQENPNMWKELVAKRTQVIDFMYKHLSGAESDERKKNLIVQKRVFPLIAAIENKVDQAHFVKSLGEKMGISQDAFMAELNKVIARQQKEGGDPHFEKTETKHQRQKRKHIILESLLGLSFFLEEKDSVLAKKILAQIDDHMGEGYIEKLLPSVTEKKKNELALTTEMWYKSRDSFTEDINELLHNLEEENLKEEYLSAQHTLREIEREGKEKEKEAISKKMSELGEKMSQLRSKRLSY